MGQVYVRIDVTVHEIALVKRYVDNGDGNEKWLHEQLKVGDKMKGRMHAMELCQQLALDHTALIFGGPLKITSSKGGHHIHINNGTAADQYTRPFMTNRKSRRYRAKKSGGR